jgi:hypothetical protein
MSMTFELAAKIYLMRQRNESHSIITQWVPMIHLAVFVANRQAVASPGLASRPVSVATAIAGVFANFTNKIGKLTEKLEDVDKAKT